MEKRMREERKEREKVGSIKWKKNAEEMKEDKGIREKTSGKKRKKYWKMEDGGKRPKRRIK